MWRVSPCYLRICGSSPVRNCRVCMTTANPIRFRDGPPRPEGIMWRIHVAGEPMLPKNLRKLASSELQSVHDGVLMIERRLLADKDPSHPVFMVKVPPGLGFVDNAPADLFFLRFDDIFNMFHAFYRRKIPRTRYSWLRCHQAWPSSIMPLRICSSCSSTTSSICSTYTHCTIPWSACFLSAWPCRSLERAHRASL